MSSACCLSAIAAISRHFLATTTWASIASFSFRRPSELAWNKRCIVNIWIKLIKPKNCVTRAKFWCQNSLTDFSLDLINRRINIYKLYNIDLLILIILNRKNKLFQLFFGQLPRLSISASSSASRGSSLAINFSDRLRWSSHPWRKVSAHPIRESQKSQPACRVALHSTISSATAGLSAWAWSPLDSRASLQCTWLMLAWNWACLLFFFSTLKENKLC